MRMQDSNSRDNVIRPNSFYHGHLVYGALFVTLLPNWLRTVLATETCLVVALPVSPLCLDANGMWCRNVPQWNEARMQRVGQANPMTNTVNNNAR